MDSINYGYYIIEPVAKPKFINLYCEKILTASDCICNPHPFLNATFWNNEENEQLKYQQKLQLSDDEFADMKKTVSSLFNNHKLDCDSRFLELSDAVSFYKKYLFHLPHLKLVGISLENVYKDSFLEEIKDTTNILHPLKNKPDGGNLLGYDILGWDYGNFHTYLCNGFEEEISRDFPLSINEFGLIQNEYSLVKKFSELIKDMPGEPVLWLPFAVWEYPTEET